MVNFSFFDLGKRQQGHYPSGIPYAFFLIICILVLAFHFSARKYQKGLASEVTKGEMFQLSHQNKIPNKWL